MYSKRGTTPGYKIQEQTAKCNQKTAKCNGQTTKCNGQNQTLSFTFSHCKYFRRQKARKNYSHLQVYNYTTYPPGSKIRTSHRDREREREKKKEKGERERERERRREKEGEKERRRG